MPKKPLPTTFAPTAKFTAIRTILALAGLQDLHLHSINISHAFINGDLDEQVYMQQPEGFPLGSAKKVLRLRKSIYVLKQASRMWYQKLQSVLVEIVFKCVQVDSSIYVYSKDKVQIILPVF